MPSTVTALTLQITDAVGNDDVTTTAMAMRGLNMAQVMGAFLYNPPELNVSGNLTVSASGTSVALSTLTNLNSIADIYNTTGSCPVSPIPVMKWNYILPAFSGTVYTKFYTRFGGTLWVNAPTAQNTLLVKYFKLPTTLTAGGDSVGYDGFDSFLVSVATMFVWACKEEGESAAIFEKFMTSFNSAFQVDAKQKGSIEEALRSGSYV